MTTALDQAQEENGMPINALPLTASAAAPAPRPVGSVRLLAAFAHEQSDPGRFCSLLARDSIAQVERHIGLAGRLVVDVAVSRATSPRRSATAAPSAC